MFTETLSPEQPIFMLGGAPKAHEVFMELIAHLDGMVRTITVNQGRFFGARFYWSFAYSALAAMRMGMSGSASFHSVRKS